MADDRYFYGVIIDVMTDLKTIVYYYYLSIPPLSCQKAFLLSRPAPTLTPFYLSFLVRANIETASKTATFIDSCPVSGVTAIMYAQ